MSQLPAPRRATAPIAKRAPAGGPPEDGICPPVATAWTISSVGEAVEALTAVGEGLARGEADSRSVVVAEGAMSRGGDGVGADVGDGTVVGFGFGVGSGVGVGVASHTSSNPWAGGARWVVPELPDPHDQPSTSPSPIEAEVAPVPAQLQPPEPFPCQ